jgi:hypothetical protein
MDIVGITTDVPVVDLGRALPFYSMVLGRGPDLHPDDRTLEWILHRAPEIAVRAVARLTGLSLARRSGSASVLHRPRCCRCRGCTRAVARRAIGTPTGPAQARCHRVARAAGP